MAWIVRILKSTFALPVWVLVAQGTLMGIGAAYVLSRPDR